MGTEIEVRDYRDAGIEHRKDYAKTIASADELLPKGLRGIIRPMGADGKPSGEPYQGVVPGKVLLVLETGRMLGVDPMAAIQGINIIEGSASIAPSLMQALVRRAGHKMRVDVTGTVEGGDIAATARLTRADEPDDPYIVTWTVQDAIAADLVSSYAQGPDGKWIVTSRSKDGNKLNWEKYTRQMLKWRAQAEVVRDGAEDVMMGVHYTPDELGAIVRDSGEIEPVTIADFVAQEDAAIIRVRELTDRADAQALVQELTDDGIWTPRVEAQFAAHLMTVTTDSRPPRAGAPGHTGDPDIDGPRVEVNPDTGEVIEDAVIVPDEPNPLPPVLAPTETPDEQLKREADEADERARIAWERENPPAPAPLDMSALEGKTD